MILKAKWLCCLVVAGVIFVLSGFSNQADRASLSEVVLDSTIIQTETVASGLNVPWEICWGADNWIWFTEQSGTISKVDPKTGQKKLLLRIPDVYRKRSLGLLGMAIHPDKNLPYVFVDYTYEQGSALLSKLVRYNYTSDTLLNPVVILNDIPGSTGHNGSRVAVSPDGKVMMTTGYGAKTIDAQMINSLNGKVLRLNIDGSIPEDNPIPGSPVYSYGHRNAQGMVFNPNNGLLYSSEHGDAIEDEINIIKKGGNYGWPKVEGYNDRPEERLFFNTHAIVEPLKSWTPVIAPAGIDFYNSPTIGEWKNSVLLATLKTQTLRVLKLNEEGDRILSEKIYFDHAFGRLRDICVSPEGDVYVSTSNRDWNPGEGYPKEDDDKIIRIFKVKTVKKSAVAAPRTNSGTGNARVVKPVSAKKPVVALSASSVVDLKAGAILYSDYCASCHKKDGTGITGTFPPLKGSPRVVGNKNEFIEILLNGLSGPIKVHGVPYNMDMPSFRFLSDKNISEISSYVRNSFGNKASLVSIFDVSKIRAASDLKTK